MTKGALYRHYKSKRDIFDSIVKRMEQQDSEQARENEKRNATGRSSPGGVPGLAEERKGAALIAACFKTEKGTGRRPVPCIL